MRLAILAAVLLLAGCATAPSQPITIYAQFDAAEAAAMMAPGKNTITGSALIRQQGGGIVTCAGNPVLLIPATTYARERMAAIYGSGSIARVGSGKTFTPDPPLYTTTSRQTMCNAQGFFKFEDVADGQFFLVTRILWTAGRYNTQQGGFVMGRATVSGSRTVEVTMTP